MSLFSDISDELTGKNLKKAYEMTEEDYKKGPEEEFVNPKKPEEPSNFVKVSATIAALVQKWLGPTLKTTKKKIIEVVIEQKRGFISGALAACVFMSGAGLVKANVDNKETYNQVKEKIEETLIDNDSLTLSDKYGEVHLLHDENGDLFEMVNGERKDIKEINPKNITVNMDNQNRYHNSFTYGTNPLSEEVNAVAREIVNAARNSNVSPEDELRRFYTSFTQRTELQDDKAYYDYITSLIVSFMNNDSKIDYKELNKKIKEEGIDSIYGGENESHSPRR